MKENNNHPYYNRPYKLIIAATIAVLIVMVMGWSILKLVEKVSDDKNDFDYTYINNNKDLPIETLIDREKQFNEHSNELTSILTSKRVLRATNEQVTSTYFTSNV